MIFGYICWYSAPLLVVCTAPVRLSYHVLLVNAKQENKRGFNVFPWRFHLLSIIMQWKSHGFPLVSREMIYTWWVNSRKIFVYDRGYGLIPMTSRFLRAYLGFRPESAPADAPLLRLAPAASRFPKTSMDSCPCLLGMDNIGHMIWIYCIIYMGFHDNFMG